MNRRIQQSLCIHHRGNHPGSLATPPHCPVAFSSWLAHRDPSHCLAISTHIMILPPSWPPFFAHFSLNDLGLHPTLVTHSKDHIKGFLVTRNSNSAHHLTFTHTTYKSPPPVSSSSSLVPWFQQASPPVLPPVGPTTLLSYHFATFPHTTSPPNLCLYSPPDPTLPPRSGFTFTSCWYPLWALLLFTLTTWQIQNSGWAHCASCIISTCHTSWNQTSVNGRCKDSMFKSWGTYHLHCLHKWTLLSSI